LKVEETMERLVVVGASLAGLRAVESARRNGFTGQVTLIGAEEHLPYDRPALSKAFLGADHDGVVTPFRSADELRDDLGVEVLLGSPALALDVKARMVIIAAQAVRYDALIVATGATPRRFPGAEGIAGVHALRTVEDAFAIRAALDAGARTVVIGAGFIGSEVASAARKRGLPVTVVEALDLPLTRSVGPDVGAVCADLHRANGTDLRLGAQVAEIESADGRVTGVTLADGTLLPADLVVAGIGVVPTTDWLADSGLSRHADGGLLCDATLATEIPGVYAAGDVAHVVNPLFDDDLMRLEHWTNAAEQGTAAAKHAVDPASAQPLASVPYFWSDWYDNRIQFVGTPRADEVLVACPADDGFVALYRRDTRLVGALTVNRPKDIMKYRRRIADRDSWVAAVEFARQRRVLPVG
jgi:NADPH-dependent 2,4-dienoyl-CoA reductase/sulfur reductase-like enzyme